MSNDVQISGQPCAVAHNREVTSVTTLGSPNLYSDLGGRTAILLTVRLAVNKIEENSNHGVHHH